jgi:transposase-like protein
MTRISKRLEIQVLTLYNWRKAWQQKEEVVPASQEDPEK